MKKFLFCIPFLFSSLFAYPTHSENITPQVQALYQLEDFRALMREVESDGPIAIKGAYLGVDASNAMWSPMDRTIYLNFSNRRSHGDLMRSILFELHNALSNKEFNYYDSLARRGYLSRSQYIEAIEAIEYANAVKTVRLLSRGMHQGVYPSESRWFIAQNFEEHLYHQKRSGHSALIGQTFDHLTQSYHRS